MMKKEINVWGYLYSLLGCMYMIFFFLLLSWVMSKSSCHPGLQPNCWDHQDSHWARGGLHICCPQAQNSQPDLHLAFCCLLACFVFGLACCSGFFVFVLLFILEKEADFGGLKSHEISFGDMEFWNILYAFNEFELIFLEFSHGLRKHCEHL